MQIYFENYSKNTAFSREKIDIIVNQNTLSLTKKTLHCVSVQKNFFVVACKIFYISISDSPVEEIVYFLSSRVETRKVFVRCSNKGKSSSFSLRLIS